MWHKVLRSENAQSHSHVLGMGLWEVYLTSPGQVPPLQNGSDNGNHLIVKIK